MNNKILIIVSVKDNINYKEIIQEAKNRVATYFGTKHVLNFSPDDPILYIDHNVEQTDLDELKTEDITFLVIENYNTSVQYKGDIIHLD